MSTLRLLGDKLAGGDYYTGEVKQNPWDQEIGPIKAFAWPMLLQAGGLAVGVAGRLQLKPGWCQGSQPATGTGAARALAEVADAISRDRQRRAGDGVTEPCRACARRLAL